QQPRRRRRGPAAYPGAAHPAGRIVERYRAVTPLPDPPAEGFLVELGRTTDIDGRDLDVADFSVCRRGSHEVPSSLRRILSGRESRRACAIVSHASPSRTAPCCP